MFEIRPYEPQGDALRVYALWQHTLGHLWPLPYNIFHALTVASPAYRQGDHLVAVSGSEVVGWVATQVRQGLLSPEGHLMALLVAPTHQRRGLGTMLHEHALASLKQRGATQIQLGGASPTPGKACRPTCLARGHSFRHVDGKKSSVVSISYKSWRAIPPLQASMSVFVQRSP